MYKKLFSIIIGVLCIAVALSAAEVEPGKESQISPASQGWVEGNRNTPKTEPVDGGDLLHDDCWNLYGNAGTTPGTNFIGTTDYNAFEIKVNGSRAFRIEPRLGNYPSILGGSDSNSMTSSTVGGVISGGGSGTNPNKILNGADFATIAGGEGNEVGANYNTISGGWGNTIGTSTIGTIGGGYNNEVTGYAAVIAGGTSNTASGSSAAIGGGYDNEASGARSTIGGGHSNSVTNSYATVAGGYGNSAGGNSAMVPGGYSNSAQGLSSFAAGYRAKADHNGSFVWGDCQASDIASTGTNEFIVRASGGVWFGTSSSPSTPDGRFINTSTGAYLTSGGTWTNSSDRNLKDGFKPVDSKDILEKVASLPVTSWHYKAEDASVEHIGPVAQDFKDAFGMGSDDKAISTVDADGVALAAIQALYHENEELKAKVELLEERLKALEETGR